MSMFCSIFSFSIFIFGHNSRRSLLMYNILMLLKRRSVVAKYFRKSDYFLSSDEFFNYFTFESIFIFFSYFHYKYFYMN
jgi:Zn-dependent protease